MCPTIEPARNDDRFEPRPANFVSITLPEVIYIGVEKRDDFDKIAALCHDHGPKENGHVLTKTIEDGKVMVVFQHWIDTVRHEVWRREVRSAGAEQTS